MKDCTELLSCSYSTLYRKVQKKQFEWRYIKGQGGNHGKQLQILLSSLPPAAQEKFFNTDNKPKTDILKEYTGKEREKADFKLRAVTEYKFSGLHVADFLKQFNENYNANVSKSQLFRWQKKEKEGGFDGLIDRRGKNSGQHSAISDEAWEYFKSLYLDQNQRSVQLCYDYTKKAYDVPSISSFYRRLKTIPNNVLVFYREGKKAFNDKCIPDMSRDVTTIQSNEIWCSDHHRLDVFVKDATGKKITRMWLTIFQDVRSNKIMAAVCRDADPNATVVKMCLKEGIKRYGVPENVYFDNGKDYRSKYFDKEFPISLVNQLGIRCMYAQPYHGQSKICERTFKTLEDRFGKMFPTYTGKDAKQRPEKMRIPNDKILEIAPEQETFIKLLYEWIEDFNNTQSKGKACRGKTPNVVYYENLHSRTVLQDEKILDILCGTFEERVISKNGISFKNRQYTNDLLLEHMGEKVIVNYSPENFDRLNVFDMDMQAICVAVPKVISPYRTATEEDFKRAQKEKKRARKIVSEFKPVRDMDIMNIIARNQFEEMQYRKQNDTEGGSSENTVTKINPVMSTNNRILEESENRRKEDSITDFLLEKWKNEKAQGG